MRDPGFYWVIRKGGMREWEAAMWEPVDKLKIGLWFVAGYPDDFYDTDMEEIDERRIERNET